MKSRQVLHLKLGRRAKGEAQGAVDTILEDLKSSTVLIECATAPREAVALLLGKCGAKAPGREVLIFGELLGAQPVHAEEVYRRDEQTHG
jgi:hypothetical protein